MERRFQLRKNKVEEQNLIPVFSQPMRFQMAFTTIKNIEKDLIIPDKGFQVWMQTDIAFNAFDIIAYMVQVKPVKHLYASTYSISKKSIESMIYLHDSGKIEQLTLLISESMIKRNPVTIDNLHAMVSTRPNVKVLYSWSHCKVNLFETHHGDYFVFEGSGNLADNAHFEQYILVNDKQGFDYRKHLFDNEQLKKYLI